MKKDIKSRCAIIYISLFLIISLFPLVLMSAFGNQPVESSESEVAVPVFRNGEGRANFNILKDYGDYFSKKFAFRRQLVALNSLIYASLFNTSVQDGVYIGKKGYMFYKDSIDSFMSSRPMEDYAVEAAAYNLAVIQKFAEKRGRKFIFTIAPNKNSLYPQFMPNRFKAPHIKRDAERLESALKKRKVNYCNLFHIFGKHKSVYYHKTDSHWNNFGAAMAQHALLKVLDKKHRNFTSLPYSVRKDFTGDLYAMLYPDLKGKEKEIYFKHRFKFKYKDGVKDVTQPVIYTENPAGKEKAGVIRDSFGNALLPFLAEEYSKVYFTKTTPYDVQGAIEEGKNHVIFQLVERNLDTLTEDAPELFTEVNMKSKTMVKKNYKGSFKAEDSGLTEGIKMWGDLDPDGVRRNSDIYLIMKPEEGGKEIRLQAFKTVNRRKDKSIKSYGYALYADPKAFKAGEYNVYMAYEYEGEISLSDTLGKYKPQLKEF